MACNSDCTKYWSSPGTAHKFEWNGHLSWVLDLRPVGTRYGVYFSVPCQRVLFTYFNVGPRINGMEFRGEIHCDEYGTRRAFLYALQPEELTWSAIYPPEANGCEPFDDLYRRHAIASVSNEEGQG